MALMLSRAKRSVGAFFFSMLLYLIPSMNGCGDEDKTLGSDAADYGAGETAYGPPRCETTDDCFQSHGEHWYCEKPYCHYSSEFEPDGGPDVANGPMECGSDQVCQQLFGKDWYCDNSKNPPICSNTPQNGDN